MAKVGSWSTTAGSNNSTPPDGWPEGQAPSTVNDCAREMMAQIRTVFNDAQWFDQNLTPTFINTTSFSVAGDQTSAIHAGRRLKIFDATAGVATTIYATVLTASFTVVTTISVSADAGQLTSSLSSFALAILSNTNPSLPRTISTTSFSAENVTISGTLTASGAVTLQTTLSVSGAVTLKTTLSVGGAVQMGSTLNVTGTTSLSAAVKLGTTLTVSGAASMLTTLSVGGATVLNSTLTASGAVTLNTTLTVSGATSLLTTLTVGGATVLKGALSVSGATNIAGTLSASAISNPVVQVHNTIAQSYTASILNRINFDGVLVDTHTFFRTASSVFAPTKSGIYNVNFYSVLRRLSTTAINAVDVRMFLNGVSAQAGLRGVIIFQAGDNTTAGMWNIAMPITNGSELTVHLSAGATSNCDTQSFDSYLTVSYLSGL